MSRGCDVKFEVLNQKDTRKSYLQFVPNEEFVSTVEISPCVLDATAFFDDDADTLPVIRRLGK